MSAIEVSDLIPNSEYLKVRAEYRQRVQAIKDARRVLAGPYLNFLFENKATMLYQVQEMIRAENMQSATAIQHEIDTYNELVPGPNQLKATLLIEIENPQARAFKLKELVGLEGQISMLIDRDFQIQAEYDRRQVDEGKISSVQFLTFNLGAAAAEALMSSGAVEILTTHPACSYRIGLSAPQVAALSDDLKENAHPA
ncbi:MAG: DUF3501 family protein [Leptospirales bacterium]|nr:DUF3501 family protein [Leptospirales bacterium]